MTLGWHSMPPVRAEFREFYLAKNIIPKKILSSALYTLLSTKKTVSIIIKKKVIKNCLLEARNDIIITMNETIILIKQELNEKIKFSVKEKKKLI